MKKLLFALPLFFLSLAVYAQQTEDDVFVGKSKTFGNFKGVALSTTKPNTLNDDRRNTKSIKGLLTLTGTVVKVGWCEDDCLIFYVKEDDGTTVAVGTKDYGFTVPKEIAGKRIFIECIAPALLIREKEKVKKEYQKDIQFVATGIKVIF